MASHEIRVIARKGQDHDKWRETDFGQERDTRDEKEYKGRRRRSVRGPLFDLGLHPAMFRFIYLVSSMFPLWPRNRLVLLP
jgi:hypothetical protein